ncbi:hypothetical protein TASIC1_0003071400 [Trichoderma asperellum]|uniref:Uncharacterized protein n=1 Tax=Trichoderma asperellum TaxID=101201 RepID=A0A6V8QPN7_TRIAP|nr:hypothetical protein TASIC1_0003071400 [Trichoderma asperellum]
MARSSGSDGILLSAPRSRAANAPQAQPAFPAEPHPRLAIMTPSRLLLGSVASSFVGFSLGAVQGGQMAQLRFRAEHAHKMPDTTAGWYLYHKSKNYHAMQGGIREGFRMGLKTGFWSLMALSLESTVDRYRGSSDMFSTVVATLTVAGAFSLWPDHRPAPGLTDRFSLSTAARTAKYGLVFGLAYGGVQDLVGLARGRPIGYVELIRRRFGSRSREGGISDKRSDDSNDANV